jgi:Zyg-11 family protein
MTTPVNFLPTNLRFLLKLTNLTSLNLSATDIKNPCFDIIIDSLENLDTFDLSQCRSIKLFNSLLKLSSKLKWLNLYNCHLHMQQNPSIYQILYQLKYLEYLDISNDNIFNDSNQPIIDNENDINRFLREENCLPRLKHFDISGQKTISSISLHQFLLNHLNLQFLGLFLTNEKYSQCLLDSNDLCYSKYRHYTYDLQHIPIVALTENDLILYEPYLFEGLTRYRDRSGFVQKILYYIFFLTRSFHSKQQNLLIELILHVMSLHPNLQSVQMASTACIYNLTRTPITEHIHVKYLADIVQATMNVMATFPNQQQVKKNKTKGERLILFCFSSYKKIVF